jgi:hypothetical protein
MISIPFERALHIAWRVRPTGPEEARLDSHHARGWVHERWELLNSPLNNGSCVRLRPHDSVTWQATSLKRFSFSLGADRFRSPRTISECKQKLRHRANNNGGSEDLTVEIWVPVLVTRAFKYFLMPLQRSSSLHVVLDLGSSCCTDAHFACSCETRDSILSANKACGSGVLA